MMKKIFFGLFCFYSSFVISSNAQAATVQLDSYLIVSTTIPPIEVNFKYFPNSTAADYPRFRQAIGKLYTQNRFSTDFLTAYDNAYNASPGGDGSANIGDINPQSGIFSPAELRETTPVTSCDAPEIPLQKVSGSAFPITLAVNAIYNCAGGTAPAHPVPSFLVSYNAPSIVTIADGNQIESVKISVSANGLPWAEYFFGYRIGLFKMAEAPIINPIFQVQELSALTLPPPAIEGSVVEYNNTIDFPSAPGGHFFYSSDTGERQYVDSGQAGHFQRTGRSFNSGGYIPVCRFYGSQTPGPNSHFFSADQNECAGLKMLQKSPVPTNVQQWNSEGNGFYTVAIVADDANGNRSCLTGTVPVYRAYNNAYTKEGVRNAWDSNHRFSTNHTEIDQLVNSHGWSDEGIAFCAPS
jgi:hypothetical protein